VFFFFFDAYHHSGLQITDYVHDGDASSTMQVKEVFPSAVEHFDINHFLKNVRERLKELYKER